MRYPPLAMAMKSNLSKGFFVTFLLWVSSALAAPPLQTPPNVGTWEELKTMGFSEWEISQYSYRGEMADGGSSSFLFSTGRGESFRLIAANGTYLTETERKLGLEQIFFISVAGEKGRIWLRVEEDSQEEEELLEKLVTASRDAKGVDSYDPGFLKIAIDHLKSRKRFPDLFFPDVGGTDSKEK